MDLRDLGGRINIVRRLIPFMGFKREVQFSGFWPE